MNIAKLLKISDFVTFLNAISGLLCIFFASMGKFQLAAIMLFAAVLFDYFDGRSARKREIENEFGKELDSLSDMVSFGVAPVVFVFILLNDIMFVPVYAIFVLAGLVRLARFNIIKTDGYFQGMPITINGIIVPILYLFKAAPFVYYAYFILASFMMVSSIRFKKI